MGTTWTGPISLTLFVGGPDFLIAKELIQHAFKCEPDLMGHVSVHFLYPADHAPVSSYVIEEYDCSLGLQDLTKELLKQNVDNRKWLTDGYAYPQNLARNIAKMGVNTPYSFVVDVDIVSLIHQVEQYQQSPIIYRYLREERRTS